MAGVASDCDSIEMYDTLQASEAAHARAHQMLEPPPRVATALPHVPDSGGVTRAAESAAVTAATGSRPPECHLPLSLWLGTRIPARAALASSHAPLPLPSLFPSLGASTQPLQPLRLWEAATAATRSPLPSAGVDVEGNGAGICGDRANASSPLPGPPSLRATAAAAPAGVVVAASDGVLPQEACSPPPAHLLVLLPPPPFVESAVATFDAPAEGAQEQRADAVEGGAGGDAGDASRTEAEDEEAGEREQGHTQATVCEVAAPGFESFTASEAPRDNDDGGDKEGGCAPPAAQADDSMHLSGWVASTSSDDDTRGGGVGSESESESEIEHDGGGGSDGGDGDDGGDDAAEDASAGEVARACSDGAGAPQPSPRPPPCLPAAAPAAGDAADACEAGEGGVDGAPPSGDDAAQSREEALAAAIPLLWSPPGGSLLPLLSSRLRSFSRADVETSPETRF